MSDGVREWRFYVDDMIAFAEKVPKVIGLKDHSSLWVSVADPGALATAIGR